MGDFIHLVFQINEDANSKINKKNCIFAPI